MIHLVASTQKDVQFTFCESPMTIDKSDEWGPGNLQLFPKGAFLKHFAKGLISHGVQPNENKTAPVGWVRGNLGLFDKSPIWILEALEVGKTHRISTLDGIIDYEAKEPAYLVCQDFDGDPDYSDSWAMAKKELEKSYLIDNPIKSIERN